MMQIEYDFLGASNKLKSYPQFLSHFYLSVLRIIGIWKTGRSKVLKNVVFLYKTILIVEQLVWCDLYLPV